MVVGRRIPFLLGPEGNFSGGQEAPILSSDFLGQAAKDALAIGHHLDEKLLMAYGRLALAHLQARMFFLGVRFLDGWIVGGRGQVVKREHI